MLPVLKRYSLHLGLAILVIIAYSNSFDSGFVLDNASIIFENPALRAWNTDNLRLILSTNYWAPKFSTDLYRPVTTLTYAINYSLFGNAESPLGYHVINVLLHWINAVAVYALIRRMTNSALASAISSAIFAVHPLATEAVTNIVGRADLLATLFVLSGLLLHLSFATSFGLRRWGVLAGLGIAASLAFFSKENGVVLLGFMFLADIMRARQVSDQTFWQAFAENQRKDGWQPYIPVIAALFLMLVVRNNVFRASPHFAQIATDNPLLMTDFWTARLTAVRVLGDYCCLFAWPAKLCCDYSFHQIPLFSWSDAASNNFATWYAFGIILTLLGIMLWAWSCRNTGFFFLATFFVAIAPIANLFFLTGTIMGERLMYLPMVGLLGALAIMITTIEQWLNIRTPNSPSLRLVLIGSLASIVILSLGYRTFLRNRDWHSDLTLWQAAAKVAPNNTKVYRALSATMFLEGLDKWSLDEIVRTAERGVAIVEQHPLAPIHRPIPTFLHAGHYHHLKSEQCTAAGRTEEARLEKERAVQLLEAAAESDRALYERAVQKAVQSRKPPESARKLGTPQIYQELGMIYLESQQNEKAFEIFQELRRMALADPDTHCCLAATLGQLGRLDEAAVSLMKMLLLGGGNQQNWGLIVQVYQQLSPGVPALKQQNASWTLAGDNPLVRQHLDQAAVELVKELIDNHQPQDARQVRDLAVSKLGCSASALDAVLKTKD